MNFTAWLMASVTARLDDIDQTLAQQGAIIMAAFDNLNAALARVSTDLAKENDLLDHLVQANRDLATQLADANSRNDPVAIQSVANKLNQLADTAEARMAADTPAPAGGTDTPAA